MILGRPAHWTHDRDSFFKYLSPEAGLAVLENRALRWSAPRQFNDPFDLGFDLYPEYDRETIVSGTLEAWWAGYKGASIFIPQNKLGRAIRLFGRLRPGLSRKEFERLVLPGIQESLERQETLLPDLHAGMKDVLAGMKVLCLSDVRDNVLMWSHYCKNHTGIVVELKCVPAVDSIWGRAKPVQYLQKMPRLLDHDKLVKYLSGQIALEDEIKLDTLLFSKAADWAYEHEWRVLRPLQDPAEDFQLLSFDPRELSGVIIGCAVKPALRERLIELVAKNYPGTRLFKAEKSLREFALEIRDL